jgi:hypothetical protein
MAPDIRFEEQGACRTAQMGTERDLRESEPVRSVGMVHNLRKNGTRVHANGPLGHEVYEIFVVNGGEALGEGVGFQGFLEIAPE